MKLFARTILTAAALCCLAAPAAALRVELKTPSVAYRADYPREAVLVVQQALTRQDAKFLGGVGINSWTNLRYAGDTRALNRFLEDLAACPGVTVSVRFKRLTEDADWLVGHSGQENRFQVEINLNSERMRVDDLCGRGAVP